MARADERCEDRSSMARRLAAVLLAGVLASGCVDLSRPAALKCEAGVCAAGAGEAAVADDAGAPDQPAEPVADAPAPAERASAAEAAAAVEAGKAPDGSTDASRVAVDSAASGADVARTSG